MVRFERAGARPLCLPAGPRQREGAWRGGVPALRGDWRAGGAADGAGDVAGGGGAGVAVQACETARDGRGTRLDPRGTQTYGFPMRMGA